MSEHEPMTEDKLYFEVMGRCIHTRLVRSIVDAHINLSGEHTFSSEEERHALRRAHFAAIRRKQIYPQQLNIGKVKIKKSLAGRFF
jgi:hypothetical protein